MRGAIRRLFGSHGKRKPSHRGNRGTRLADNDGPQVRFREIAIFTERPKLVRMAAVLIWGLWLLDLGVGAYLHSPEKTDATGLIVGADFVEFYAAGQTLLEGKSGMLYAQVPQSALQNQIAHTHLSGQVDFLYPPFVAIPFILFALLPFLATFAIYVLANLALLRSCLRLLGEPSTAMLLLVMSGFPVFAVASYGHYTFLTMFLVAGTYVLWRRSALFWAGPLFSLTAYKPNLMLGVLLLWLLDWKKAYRALIGVGVGVAALVLVCVIALPEASRSYVRVLAHDLPALQAGASARFVKRQTLYVFWNLLLPAHPMLVKALAMLSQACAAVAFFLLWRRKPVPEVAFAFALLLSFWLTPYVPVYDISLLVISAILLWNATGELKPALKGYYLLFHAYPVA
jgi:hypothetical protein